MNGLVKIAAALAIVIGSFGAAGAAWANQQLNGQQAVQFLTSKPNLRSTDGVVATWRPNGTYTLTRRGGSPISGTFSVSNNGQVCWRGQSGASGCFVVFRDNQGYYGRGRTGTWRYQ
jgi:hypothetical protein